jgi:hypothetical protein
MEPTIVIALVTLAAAAAASVKGDKPTPVGPHEFGLNDLDLWNLVYTGRNPLVGVSFEQAVLQDPRRIFGLIEQQLFEGISGIVRQPPEVVRMQLALQLEKFDWLRQRHDGQLPLSALVTFEDAYAPIAMEMSVREMPDEARAAMRAGVGRIANAFDGSKLIADRAAWIARRSGASSDAMLWEELSESIDAMEHRLLSEFSGPTRLSGPQEGLLLPGTRLGDDEVNG